MRGKARFDAMGDAGMLGDAAAVQALADRAAIERFLRDGVLTPAFMGLSARALGAQCLEGGLAREGDGVAIFRNAVAYFR